MKVYVIVEDEQNYEFSFSNILTDPPLIFADSISANEYMKNNFKNELNYSQGGTDSTYSVIEVEIR